MSSLRDKSNGLSVASWWPSCAEPQACCYADGTCLDPLALDFMSSSGIPQGLSTDCASLERGLARRKCVPLSSTSGDRGTPRFLRRISRWGPRRRGC
jgi:hypothetical protein